MHSELKVPQLNLLNKFHGRNLVIMLLMTWRSNILCHSASNFGSVWGTLLLVIRSGLSATLLKSHFGMGVLL